jgi:hypothetical protein
MIEAVQTIHLTPMKKKHLNFFHPFYNGGNFWHKCRVQSPHPLSNHTQYGPFVWPTLFLVETIVEKQFYILLKFNFLAVLSNSLSQKLLLQNIYII